MDKNINFRLDNIEVIEKRVNRCVVSHSEDFNYEIKTQSAVDESKELVIIIIAVQITKLSKPSEILANFLIAMGFKIENFSDAFNKTDEGKFIIPHYFENGLKTIVISTTRGIIFSNLAGTYLQGANLPIIFADALKPAIGSLINVDNVVNE